MSGIPYFQSLDPDPKVYKTIDIYDKDGCFRTRKNRVVTSKQNHVLARK